MGSSDGYSQKNLKGIYEYDRGVQGSENLLFYKEIKKRSHMTS